MWSFRFDLVKNFLLHRTHESFGSEWKRICPFNWPTVLKHLPSGHILHLNFLSSLWVVRWFCKVLIRANLLSQTEHTKGFSPVCILLCISRADDLPKHFRQTSHWWVLSCIFLCDLRPLSLAKTLLHVRQENIFFLLWDAATQSESYKLLVCINLFLLIISTLFVFI